MAIYFQHPVEVDPYSDHAKADIYIGCLLWVRLSGGILVLTLLLPLQEKGMPVERAPWISGLQIPHFLYMRGPLKFKIPGPEKLEEPRVTPEMKTKHCHKMRGFYGFTKKDNRNKGRDGRIRILKRNKTLSTM